MGINSNHAFPMGERQGTLAYLYVFLWRIAVMGSEWFMFGQRVHNSVLFAMLWFGQAGRCTLIRSNLFVRWWFGQGFQHVQRRPTLLTMWRKWNCQTHIKIKWRIPISILIFFHVVSISFYLLMYLFYEKLLPTFVVTKSSNVGFEHHEW